MRSPVRVLCAMLLGVVIACGVSACKSDTSAPGPTQAATAVAPAPTTESVASEPVRVKRTPERTAERKSPRTTERAAPTATRAPRTTDAPKTSKSYESSGDAQRDWGCQQGYITEGC